VPASADLTIVSKLSEDGKTETAISYLSADKARIVDLNRRLELSHIQETLSFSGRGEVFDAPHVVVAKPSSFATSAARIGAPISVNSR
jgi:hypothetical protein